MSLPPQSAQTLAARWDPAASSTASPARSPGGKGLHSSTIQLNLSAFCGIGGAFMSCLEDIRGYHGVSGGIWGYQEVSWVYLVSETAQVELKVDECKALPGGSWAGWWAAGRAAPRPPPPAAACTPGTGCRHRSPAPTA